MTFDLTILRFFKVEIELVDPHIIQSTLFFHHPLKLTKNLHIIAENKLKRMISILDALFLCFNKPGQEYSRWVINIDNF